MCVVLILLQGFDHHVKHEHCMWDYIYYYIHLGKIDVSDHNAIESYVYQQVQLPTLYACNFASI